jgi:predicted RNA-binding protein associated with RNAse of E/G family
VLVAGDRASVRILKPEKPEVIYDVTVVSDDGNHILVTAPWAEPEARDVGFAVFEPGDRFVEHYWRDRWYSIKEVRSSDGQVKGWYTDIARPARVEDDVIVYEDLELDLWVSGDRTTILRLDEDEFEASGIEDSDPDAAKAARSAFEFLADLPLDRWDAVLL